MAFLIWEGTDTLNLEISGDRLQRSRIAVNGRDVLIMQGVPVPAPLLA
jgi:hypothetical protein